MPTVQTREGQEEIPRECHSYKLVTEDLWLGHLEDLKRDAKSNEEIRLRAMRGKAWSSEELPAEALERKLHHRILIRRRGFPSVFEDVEGR